MSELTTAARPYAKAVFEAAQSAGDFDKWTDSLSLLGGVMSDTEVQALLAKPQMSQQAGGKALVDLCDGKLDSASENLVMMLSENSRLSLLPEISTLYTQMRDEAEGMIEAQVTAASELDDAQQKSIAEALTKRLGREVKLTVNIDESIMGGAIIRAKDLVIDGSLRGRIEKMQSSMKG